MTKPIMRDIAPAVVRNKPKSQNRSVIKDTIRRITPIIKAVIPIIKNPK
jgi:hypothetical protein